MLVRRALARSAAAVAALLLSACAPALNWRDVSVADAGLLAQFPCKPKLHAQAGLGLMQCEVKGQRFVLSWRQLGDPAQAKAALAQSPAESADRLKARLQPAAAARLPQGALAWPGSGRYRIEGAREPAWLMVWARGLQLQQALVVGAGDEAAAQQFFDSLRSLP